MQTMNSGPSSKSRSPRAHGSVRTVLGRLFSALLCFPCLPGSATLAAVLLIAGAAAGQSPTLLSLDQAIDLALTHNHALKATRTLILQNQDRNHRQPSPQPYLLERIASSSRFFIRRISPSTL